ncbi:Cmr1p [Sugiyamaella lignohabitans]|uniref:DNA damage-binding protein CMR1 n=1 Tax=Sugiyamaella lignohabitans TaxID=796027 RepID=A0A167CT76_9ASCO|nr:Cmr1p [Sugiyamaella lignohabitans]ANB12079.1 Cmr1p [Sugiyamaella lignohabitans]
MFSDVRQKSAKTARSSSNSSSRTRRAPRVKQEVDLGPRRKSRRLEGKKAEFDIERETAERLLVIEKQAAQEDKARKEGELKLADVIKNGEWDQALGLLSSLGKVSQGDYFEKIKKEEEQEENDGGTRDSDNSGLSSGKKKELVSARKELSNLSLHTKISPNDIKVTSERIFSVAFHPSETKRIVLAGDKMGELGLWDIDSTNKIKDEGDYEYETPNILSFKVHTRAIATILMPQFAPDKAYTASYDGSVRCLDLGSGTSTEAFVYDSDPRNPVGVSDCAMPDANTLYYTTLEGEFGIHDLRENQRKPKSQLLRLHDKKIGGFSFNPNAIHQIATGSLDRTLKVWDLRATSVIAESEDNEKAPHMYGEYQSRLSISATDWNSAGQIVCNGYDDTINVFDLSTSKSWTKSETHDIVPSVRLKHNCQTGRWVSILKSRWQPRPADSVQKFVIANMKRYLDIYSADGQQLAHLGHELMSAVPAVVQFHPSQNWLVGGSASGKLYLWE